jgi:hypothetical protein
MDRSRVSFSPTKRRSNKNKSSNNKASSRSPRSSPRARHANHGTTLHGGIGRHVAQKNQVSAADFYEERIWDVERSKQEFITQGRFMPTFDETTSLLRDVCEHLNYTNQVQK